MIVTNDNLTIYTSSGPFEGYMAVPESGSGPGIIVIQEIFGVNTFVRLVADGLAAQGFVALAPDLFWRLEPGIILNDRVEGELARAFELFGAFNVDTGVKDIQSSIDALRGHPACNGKIGAVGFCLGGLLAYLTATRTDCDAAVGYYGVSIDSKLDEAAKLKKPLMLHIAGEDKFVSKPAQEAIVTTLKDNPLVTLHRYPGRDHAFARVGGENYAAEDARLAGERTLAFFRDSLS